MSKKHLERKADELLKKDSENKKLKEKKLKNNPFKKIKI